MAVEIQEGFGYNETLAIARLADESRVEGLMLAEHYCSPGDPHSTTDAPDAWIYLGALARETENVKIGTLVSPITFRHPAVYAKMAATLDLVSGGRAELGLGAGWLGAEHSAYGFPFPDGPTRVSMLAEQLEIINGLWATSSFSFKGNYYSLRECSFTPKRQGFRPPLLVGGQASSLRLLSVAARFADEYVLTRGTPEECRLVKQALAARSEKRRALPDAVRLGLFARLALHDEGTVSPYKGKEIPSASDHEWIVGSMDAVRSRLLRFREAGVDSLYISVETARHAEAAVAIAEVLHTPGVQSASGP
ncbi:LLM class flavin-dependent oxidoreductase [Streptomyces sp. NPDC088350]|uniref:LLM class flavin-dependent oxidoreductase n=1 Tax=Streptomyces sp. NPDC088350 TaxID=3365854 RepID=UPI00382AEBD9